MYKWAALPSVLKNNPDKHMVVL